MAHDGRDMRAHRVARCDMIHKLLRHVEHIVAAEAYQVAARRQRHLFAVVCARVLPREFDGDASRAIAFGPKYLTIGHFWC